MRHLLRGRKLNRSSSHRIALKRNLATRLFAHDRIKTTLAKAKELRPYAEKLITIAKKGAAQLALAASATGDEQIVARTKALYARRRLIQELGGKKTVVIKDDYINVIDKLLNDIGARYQERSGGYTRILKLTERRLGDAGRTALIELLPAGAPRRRERRAAPKVAS